MDGGLPLIGKILIATGAILVVAGALFVVAGKTPHIGAGRLPGDFVIRKGNFTLYIPLATSLVVSLLLTLILWVVSLLLRR